MLPLTAGKPLKWFLKLDCALIPKLEHGENETVLRNNYAAALDAKTEVFYSFTNFRNRYSL